MQDGRPPTQHHFMVVEMWMGGPAVAEVELAKDVWVDVEQDEGGKVAEAAAAFKTKVGGDRLIKGTAICTTTCYPSAVDCLRCASLRFVQFIGFTPHADPLNGLCISPYHSLVFAMVAIIVAVCAVHAGCGGARGLPEVQGRGPHHVHVLRCTCQALQHRHDGVA